MCAPSCVASVCVYLIPILYSELTSISITVIFSGGYSHLCFFNRSYIQYLQFSFTCNFFFSFDIINVGLVTIKSVMFFISSCVFHFWAGSSLIRIWLLIGFFKLTFTFSGKTCNFEEITVRLKDEIHISVQQMKKGPVTKFIQYQSPGEILNRRKVV